MSARIIPFPQPTKGSNMEVLKHALVVAAIIAVVVLVNNMAGKPLSNALAPAA
jgi:hypothetical protein